MIRSLTRMEGFQLHAADGDLGRVDDFYFDDEAWAIRYLIVETGNWLTGRRVLISPISVERVDWAGRHIHVSLTRDQVKHSPDIDIAQPVSRRQEAEYLRYFGWPTYWSGGPWGPGTNPSLAAASSAGNPPPAPGEPETDAGPETHLRSVRAVVGYRLLAEDREFGRLADLLAQDFNWSIQYLVAEVTAWEPRRAILLRPRDTRRIDWTERDVATRLAMRAVQQAPTYDEARPPEPGPWINDEPGGAR